MADVARYRTATEYAVAAIKGLIDLLPHRGALVAGISRQEMLSERYRRAYLQLPTGARESTKEHWHLLELLRAGDGEAAAAFMQEHNEKTIRVLVESYEEPRA